MYLSIGNYVGVVNRKWLTGKYAWVRGENDNSKCDGKKITKQKDMALQEYKWKISVQPY